MCPCTWQYKYHLTPICAGGRSREAHYGGANPVVWRWFILSPPISGVGTVGNVISWALQPAMVFVNGQIHSLPTQFTNLKRKCVSSRLISHNRQREITSGFVSQVNSSEELQQQISITNWPLAWMAMGFTTIVANHNKVQHVRDLSMIWHVTLAGSHV